MKLAWITIVIIMGALCSGATLHVPGDYPTIQEALDAASTGDTVLVASGTYREPLLWPDLETLTLEGETQAAEVLVRGTNTARALTRVGDEFISMTISELTFADGKPISGTGGGLHIVNADLLMQRCIIRDNLSEHEGGGAYFANCHVAIEGCRFQANQTGVQSYWTGDGLAAYFTNCTGSVANSVIRDHTNWYMNGAGFCANGNVDFTHNLFERNVQEGSDYIGGALSISGPCLIKDNVFRNNGGIGAAIGVTGEQAVEIINNLFVDNTSAFFRAGTIEIWSGSVYAAFNTLVNCEPVAIANYYAILTAHNNIIVNSECGLFHPDPSISTISDYNLLWNQYDYGNVEPGSHDLHVEPNFVAADDADFLLSQTACGQPETSAAVDSADPAVEPPVGTTRTDGLQDEPSPDRGYHYPLAQIRTPTPTPTNTQLPTETPTPSPEPTASPEPSPTITPEPSPEPTRTLTITTNQQFYREGDPFILSLTIENPGAELTADLYIALDIGSAPELYYFWPSWVQYPPTIDWEQVTIWTSGTITGSILSFTWPEGAGTGTDWLFHAALVNPGNMKLLEYDSCSFSFGTK